MWRRRLGLPLLRSRSSSYQQQQHHHHLLPNPNEKPLALNLLRLFTSQAGSDSSSFIKPFIAFVLGGPGSGKGTQCSRIASNFGFAHLSVGDLLRNEISSGSENGELILDIIKEGRIVPSEITVELIRKAMESSNTKRVLIDGFPRCEENRIAFERMGWIPSPLLSIHIKNIHKGKHGSDSKTYDTEGRFDPSKFDAIFSKYGRTQPNALTKDELSSMLKASRNMHDFIGWVVSAGEWMLLYSVAKDKEGLLQRETIRGLYDGSLFERLQDSKKSS